jgi:hypothetical protein
MEANRAGFAANGAGKVGRASSLSPFSDNQDRLNVLLSVKLSGVLRKKILNFGVGQDA